MENADVFLGLHDFLERMRKPAAADFVKSIKSFIVSFSNNAPDTEKDCAAVQEFFSKMEAAFRAHPLWSGGNEEELETAGEGLEKYVMTKLFPRVFASLPEDAKYDEQLSEKMALIQQFISPENLDIKPTFQNETSWLLAQKELQKINMYKAPRDKLVCILNCCKVINNLLLNASIASNENMPGADEFLPVLIYVTVKANPPQFHANLLYIQRYRRQSKLVGEAAYFFTNALSAESFISNINAKALSMEEAEFEKNMEFARTLLSGLNSQSNQTDRGTENSPDVEPTLPKTQTLNSQREKEIVPSRSSENLSGNKELLNKGAALLLKDNKASNVFQEYPYIFASAGDLTISDVEELLNNYKQLVIKYVCLSKGLSYSTIFPVPTSSPLQAPSSFDAVKESENHKTIHPDVNPKMGSNKGGNDLSRVLQFERENAVHKPSDGKHGDFDTKVPEAKDEDADSKVPGPQAVDGDADLTKQPKEDKAAS